MKREEIAEGYRIAMNGEMYCVQERRIKRENYLFDKTTWRTITSPSLFYGLKDAVARMNQAINSRVAASKTRPWTPIDHDAELAKLNEDPPHRPTHLSTRSEIKKELRRVTNSSDKLREAINKLRDRYPPPPPPNQIVRTNDPGARQR